MFAALKTKREKPILYYENKEYTINHTSSLKDGKIKIYWMCRQRQCQKRCNGTIITIRNTLQGEDLSILKHSAKPHICDDISSIDHLNSLARQHYVENAFGGSRELVYSSNAI